MINLMFSPAPTRPTLIEPLQHRGPSVLMPIAGLLIRESRVDKAQKRSGALRSQINCHHGLSAERRHLSQDLHQRVWLQLKEPAIMRMALAFEICLEIKDLVYASMITEPGAANQRSNC